jgi:hypothetical protein
MTKNNSYLLCVIEMEGPTGGVKQQDTGATGPTGDIGTGPTGGTETGATGLTGETGMYYPIPEPIPDFLSLDDILSDQEIIIAKEAADKSLLDQIGSQHVSALKPKLVEWVGRGKPHAYPVMMLSIQPPSKCSDGVERNLPEYITFCSGKSIQEHVGLLQAKLSGMSVSFANIGGQVAIVVSP